MKHTFLSRLLICLLAVCLVLGQVSYFGLTARAEGGQTESLQPGEPVWAPSLPAANAETRHVVCTQLSDQALAYYTGSNTYESSYHLDLHQLLWFFHYFH